ncbi:MAG: glycosyltransferase family 39 protein, partial [Nitrospirae bacterium]|nr:glycosyltransferase family 39 protein [Nitrospirota bacterium]
MFAGILAAGALARLLFLQGLDRGVNSDEAWTGLMALSILRGEYPIFLPGQGYMGSMEAYATAVVFLLFGSGPTALYVVPFLLSVLLIVLIHRLGRRLWGETGGAAAALFTALPPAFLVVYGNSPRLGYIETLVWGTLLLLLA